MHRKWGILILLLPLPTDGQPPFTLIHPIATSDRLSQALLAPLVKIAPVTFPLSLFKNKKLILNVLTQDHGHLIAVFPDLAPLHAAFKGRLHLLLVTTHIPYHNRCFVGNAHMLAPLSLPLLTATPSEQSLFPSASVPYYIAITPSGQVQLTEPGFYVTAQNIHQLWDSQPSSLRVTSNSPFKNNAL